MHNRRRGESYRGRSSCAHNLSQGLSDKHRKRKGGLYWLSDKIIRTAYITQRTVGNKRGPLNDDQERESLCR
jgi:hypothetical protein